MKRPLSLLLLLFSFAAAGSDLPPQSIYHLNAQLTNQSGKQQGLDVYRGQPVLVTMFYSSCQAVCPLLIESIRATESTLTAEQRSQLRVLLISIDPERDTVQALQEIAKTRKVDTTRWTLARADSAAVRKIAAILNIQYRKLPDGDFNHSSVITLLDRQGVSTVQSSKLGGEPDAALVAALRKMVN